MRDLTAVSLFSGIGGLDHGLALAGFRHLLMCEGGGDPNGTKAERDQWKQGVYRRAVLRARFPGVPIADDVRDVGHGGRDAGGRPRGTDGDAQDRDERWSSIAALGLEGATLIAGGSPCQDLSVAGQRRGLVDGERSSLFFEMCRVIDAVRPRWVLWENVPGAFSSQGGRDFGAVLGTLADLGYGLGWRTLDSRFFGVPQRRRRVFVVGTLADGDPRAAAERAGQVLAVGTRCGRHPATRGEAREDPSAAPSDGARGGGEDVNYYVEDHENGPLRANGAGGPPRTDKEDDENLVAYSLRRDPGGTGQGHNTNYVASFGENMRGEVLESPIARALASGGGKPGQGYSAVREGASVRRLTPTECERLQALPDGWTLLNGTADSPRYAALGDAVTASVGYWIGTRIIKATA